MADEFRRLIEHVPDVLGDVRASLGAVHAEHRFQIRESLCTRLGISKPMTQTVPDDKKWSISISHTKDLGGWLAIPKPKRIGFDVERLDRLSLATIRRISTDEELAQAPDVRLLWTAKEACFKSLYNYAQPKTLPEITISGWGPPELSNLWTFANDRGNGWALLGLHHAYCVFTYVPN